MLMKVFCSLLLISCVLPAAAADTAAGSVKLVRRAIRDIVVTPDGIIYVLDGGRRQVLKLDQSGKVQWCAPIVSEPDHWLHCLVLATRSPWNLLVTGNGEPLRDVSVDGKVSNLFDWIDSYGDRVPTVDGTGRMFVPNPDKNRVEIYVSNLDNSPPTASLETPDLVMDRNSGVSCVKVIDGSAPGPTHLSRPHAVFVDYVSGRIWVLDQTYAFKVYDSSGKLLFPVKASDPKNRSFTGVGGMEFDSDGNTYMMSAEMHGILKYDKNGKLLRKIRGYFAGPFGSGSSSFYYAGFNGGELQPDGKLAPAQIKVYDRNGVFTRTIIIPEE